MRNNFLEISLQENQCFAGNLCSRESLFLLLQIANVKKFCERLTLRKGEEVVAVQSFGELTLAIVVNCVFGGEEYLPTQRLTHLWELTNKNFGNHFMTVMLFGSTV